MAQEVAPTQVIASASSCCSPQGSLISCVYFFALHTHLARPSVYSYTAASRLVCRGSVLFLEKKWVQSLDRLSPASFQKGCRRKSMDSWVRRAKVPRSVLPLRAERPQVLESSGSQITVLASQDCSEV